MNKNNTIEDGFTDLWVRFNDAAGDDYFYYWLALQTSLINNVLQGLLVMEESGTDSFTPKASWPQGGADPRRLEDICESSLEQRCGLLAQLPASGDPQSPKSCYAVSYPVLIDGRMYGVVALEVAAGSEDELVGCMEQLQWGVSWLKLHDQRRRCEAEGALLAGMKTSFDLLANVLSEERFSDAAMVFVTELSTLMACDRASIGFLKGKHVYVEAISHSATFGRQMNLVRFIAAAMEESIVQRGEIVYPHRPDAKVVVNRAHETLSRDQSGEAVVTMTLHAHDRYYGALTLERPADRPFDEKELKVCRGVLALVAPILEEKRRNGRHIVLKLLDSLNKQVERLLGRGYYGRKLAVAALIVLVVFFARAEGEYRLSADTTLEPLVRRSIASPFNGYVKDASVRAGDLVKKGDVLCSLDSRDLHLEQSRWLNQKTQYERERQEAIASRDRAKANIIASQLEQAVAQLNLVRSQLKRTSLSAPFDGIVVSGDLSQRIDGAVEQGEVLFELAPLDAWRVILRVDEYRIADVRPGQRGSLVLPALMDRNFAFDVKKITPISSQDEGKNYFRVEAALRETSDVLRPGMEGVGKISVDRRRLLAIWTRDLTDWARMKVWRWCR